VLELIEKPSGKQVELTKDLSAWREYNKLSIGRLEKTDQIDNEWQINIGKETKIPELGIRVITTIVRQAQKLSDPSCQLFDKSGINLPFKVRFRQTGDRFVPFRGREKKLKDLLIDDKIPQSSKDRLPLLCDRNNILWIIGSRRANFGLITKSTKEIIKVKVKK
jgi:tRNA(Ile)-lysidine synthase